MVEEVIAYSKKENIAKIISITVDIGKFSGVQKEPFEFAFPIVSEGTILDGATLNINMTPCVIKCEKCSHLTELKVPFIKCEKCDSKDVKYVSGKEFAIKSMEVENV